MTYASTKEARHKLVEAVVAATIAFQVLRLREARGWSQSELAERSGVSIETIYRLEIGERLTTVETLRKIAAAFDCGLIIRLSSWKEFFDNMRMHFDPPSPFGAEAMP